MLQPDLSGVDPSQYNAATRVSVGDALTRTAAVFPDRAAVIDRGDPISYRALNEAAEGLARALLSSGVGRQQPVALLMDNSWRMLASYFACAKAGLIALPLNAALAADDIGWILHDARVSTLVADAAHVGAVERINPDVSMLILAGEPSVDASDVLAGNPVRSWDELAATPGSSVRVPIGDRDTVQCLYTSGTTSRPKGVLTSHTSVLIAGMTNALILGATWGSEHHTLINVLPLFHTTALNALVLPTLFAGGTAVLPGRFDPDVMLDAIETHSATHIMLLPNMYRALLVAQAAAPRAVDSVRRAVYAMAPMPKTVLDELASVFPNAAVILGSGQTEVVPVTVLQWPEHQRTKPDSWGPAVPTVDVAIMGPDGTLLPDGVEGEIVYRGPHVCTGYYGKAGNAEANRDAFAHGWFHSGDVGYRDTDGVVWFTDRLKDIIKSGGENVSSVEVERVVAAVPGVADCCVLGRPDDRWGEAVCAVVTPADPTAGSDARQALQQTVIDYAKAHLAGFKVPKQVLVVDALPKTATGKVRKNQVRTELSR